MGEFIADSVLQGRLADLLHLASVANLPATWNSIITDANNAAFQDIQSALLQRGFTAAQIQSWDRGAEYETDIGLYWCLVKGAALHSYDSTFMKMLDRRAELRTVTILAGGTVIEPGETVDAGVGFGQLNTANDIFVMNPNHRGRITRW